MNRIGLILILLVVACYLGSTVITEWNFESQSLEPSTGSGIISLTGGVTHDTFNSGYNSSYAWSTMNYPLQGTNNLTGGIQIEAPTTGHWNIILNWVTRHSNTSANREVLFYTLDKTATEPVWTQAATYNNPNGDAWFVRSFDGTQIPGLDDNANLAFRIVSAFADSTNTQYLPSNPTSTYAATGKWRFDDISVQSLSATPDFGLIINEVCSSNASLLQDSHGLWSDWIELKNTSSDTLDLHLYGLSDSQTNIYKFRFPAGSKIAPGQIIMVWAVNNVTPVIDPNGDFWGTNFAISSSGEPIVLSLYNELNVASPIDLCPSDRIDTDRSRGRTFTGLDWYYFVVPTPRAENTTQGYSALLSDPVANNNSGWFSNPVDVNFTTTDTLAVLHYTVDGSDPTDSSPVWSGPQTLHNRSDDPNLLSMISTVLPNLPPPVSELDMWFPPQTLVPKIHTVKIRSFGPGALPSNIVTRVYMVGINLYEFPVISLTMNPDDLFDPDTGIYVAGNGYDGVSFDTANFMQPWDKDVVSDWFDRYGNHFYQKSSQVRIQGTYTTRAGQKSLRLKSGSLTGPLSFNYPFFGTDYLTEFESLILRNHGNDAHISLLRDNLAETLLGEQGLPISRFQPYVVFLNGEFWGIHSVQEHSKEKYLSNHFNIPVEEIDLLESNLEVQTGDSIDYAELLSYITQNDESDPAVWQYLETRIDFDNYTEYMAGQIIAGNSDWPGNNNRYWRKRVPFTPGAPYGHDGRWRWLVYDLDYSMGLYQSPSWVHDTLARCLNPTLDWRTLLFRNIITNTGFRNNFINTLADRLNYNWKPVKVIAKINQLENLYANTIPAQIERWNFPGNFSLWQGEVEALRTFATNRPDFLRGTIVSNFGLPGTAVVNLQITPPEVATVTFNNRITLSGGSYVYFQGVPIGMKTIIPVGWEIVDFGGQSTDSLYLNPLAEQTIQLTLQRIAPTNIMIVRDSLGITLNWNDIPAASGYQIETATTPYPVSWDVLATVTVNQYAITETEPRRFYRVKALY